MERKSFSLPEKITFTIAIVVIISAIIAAAVYINNGRNDTVKNTVSSSDTSGNEEKSASSNTSHPPKSDERIVALEKLSDEGKYSEVEKAAETIIKTNPGKDTLIDALWELSLAESAQGKSNEAIEHATAVGKYESADSHYLLGLIYIDNKDYAKAKEELTLAKKEDPDFKDEIDEFLKQLEEISE